MLQIERPLTAQAALAVQAGQAARQGDGAGAGCVFVGGGTALQLAWGDRAPAACLIDVSALGEAQGIAVIDGQLRLGAAVRLEALRRDARVAEAAPLLAQACQSLAALSVRHLGTLGGNVGWGFGDSLPALLAMDAEAELADGTTLPLDTLLAQHTTLPLLLAVRVDAQRFAHERAPALLCRQQKVGLRSAFSQARINLALTATHIGAQGLADVRVAASAAGVRARRLRRLEQYLEAGPARLSFADCHAACAADLPDHDEVARLAARMVAGWLRPESS